jgi:DNA-binding beta-propeller fold protein YncE
LVVCFATACSKATPLPPTVTPVPTSAALATSVATAGPGAIAATAAPYTIAKNPSYSSPIAISDDNNLLVVANPLNDSISVFNVAGDANGKLAEIQMGDEPRSVAITPDKRLAYVTNQCSGTLSVIDLAAL